MLQANGRVQTLESEHETLVQNLAAMKDETGRLMVALEEERVANAHSQMSLAQLLGEFSSSVSAAEEAAVALTASQHLSESIASVLSGLDFALAQAKTQTSQAHGNEQLKLVGLEMDLEEKSKAAADAVEECARLSSIVKQLEGEKKELESKVSWCAGLQRIVQCFIICGCKFCEACSYFCFACSKLSQISPQQIHISVCSFSKVNPAPNQNQSLTHTN
jgi:hypothetical protein